MSLVGPRPYLARKPPGMTGYWQVSARSSVSFAERLEMEARYVRNWSVWWDAILLVQTPLVILRDEVPAK